jgi:hypothetical protein
VEEMSENLKPFFRESNIWRLLGFGTALLGVILMVVFPSESYPDIIIYQSRDQLGNVSMQVTVWHTIIATGMLGFYPTIKEFIVRAKNK